MSVEPEPKPLVASLCGTFLKPEMQSVYRQITGLRRHRTVVFTERRRHADLFPFEPVIEMEKPAPALRYKPGRPGEPPKLIKVPKRRPRGNFIRRFYYKHLLGQWPPPERPKPPTPPPGPALPPAALAPAPEPVFNETYNLVNLLRAHGADLAHVYYGHKAVKYLPMLRRWGGPWVVSFHGVDVTADIYGPPGLDALGGVFAHARLVLARSQALLDRLAELGCPPEKLRLNRTPIPFGHLVPTVRQPPADGRWVFLQACRLIPKKGLLTTLRAFREVAGAWPQARLVIAGSGPMTEEIRAATGDMGLHGSVELAGWCSQERLTELYQEAHVFVHPSETTESGDREGIPNTLLEAMATGLPVAATRHGGIPEAVTHGSDGLLAAEKSPQESAAALLRLTREPGLLATFSAQASASVRARFAAELQVERLEDSYAEAVNIPNPL